MGRRLRRRSVHHRRREPADRRRLLQLLGARWCRLLRELVRHRRRERSRVALAVHGRGAPEPALRPRKHPGAFHHVVHLRDRRLRGVGPRGDPVVTRTGERCSGAVPGEADLRVRPADDPRSRTAGEHPVPRTDPLVTVGEHAGVARHLQRPGPAVVRAVLLPEPDPAADGVDVVPRRDPGVGRAVDDRRSARHRPDVHGRRRGDLRHLLGGDDGNGAGGDRTTDPELGDADPRVSTEPAGRREGDGAVHPAGHRHRRGTRRTPRRHGEPTRHDRAGLRHRSAARGLYHVQAVRGDRRRAAHGDAPHDAPDVWERVRTILERKRTF